MASIPDLPNELVLSICEFLAEDFSSLEAMCLTSRTIGLLAKNVLYERLDLREPGHRLWPLIRTFIDQPHLAQKVKTLTCCLNINQRYGDNSQQSAGLEHCDFVGKVALHLSQLLPKSPRVVGHILSSMYSASSQTSMVALLFLLVPHLDDFDLRTWHRVGPITYPGPVESIYGPLLSIVADSELRHITGRLDKVRTLFLPIRLFKLLCFFDFRSLDTLSLSLVEHNENACYMGDVAEFLIRTKSFPRLRHLIVYTTIQEFEYNPALPREEPYLLPYVTGAICAPSHLKPTQNMFRSLELRLWKTKVSSMSLYSLKPVVSSLQSIKDSLIELRIIAPCGPAVQSEEWQMFRFVAIIPNMGLFLHLRLLVAPSEFRILSSFRRPPHRQIDLTRYLPTSLRTLGLNQPGGVAVPWLKGLLHQIKDFASLKIIWLDCMPQRGRSASWFRKHKHARGVFKALKSHGISVVSNDIAEGPRPRKDSSRGDILDVHDGALITGELGRRVPLYEAASGGQMSGTVE